MSGKATKPTLLQNEKSDSEALYKVPGCLLSPVMKVDLHSNLINVKMTSSFNTVSSQQNQKITIIK